MHDVGGGEMFEPTSPWWSFVVRGAIVYVAFALAFATARSKVVDKLVEGEAVLVAREGRVFHAALKRNNIPESDLDEAVRHAGLASLAEVEMAMLA